jgi:hypothetical protein
MHHVYVNSVDRKGERLSRRGSHRDDIRAWEEGHREPELIQKILVWVPCRWLRYGTKLQKQSVHVRSGFRRVIYVEVERVDVPDVVRGSQGNEVVGRLVVRDDLQTRHAPFIVAVRDGKAVGPIVAQPKLVVCEARVVEEYPGKSAQALRIRAVFTGLSEHAEGLGEDREDGAVFLGSDARDVARRCGVGRQSIGRDNSLCLVPVLPIEGELNHPTMHCRECRLEFFNRCLVHPASHESYRIRVGLEQSHHPSCGWAHEG